MINPWIALARKGLVRAELLGLAPSMAELRLLDEEIG